MADQTTRVVDLIRRNESAFTFSLSNNASVLESLIDSFYQKKLIVTEKTADNDTTSERASLLMKNIVTVLDSDPSIVIKVFNEHKILKELLSILEIKNKEDDTSPLSAATDTKTHMTEDATKPGGGSYDDDLFVTNPPKDYQCPVCYLTMKDPLLLSCCGTQICQACGKGVNNCCPVCRNTSFTSILDKKTRGKILSLKVKCKNVPCTWTGELLDLDRHTARNCQYAMVSCRLGCGAIVTRITLAEHESTACDRRTADNKLKGLQRIMLMKVVEATGRYHDDMSTTKPLLPGFQGMFNGHFDEISNQQKESLELESSIDEKIGKLRGSIQNKFEDHENNLTKATNTFESSTKTVSTEVMASVEETRNGLDKAKMDIEKLFAATKDENQDKESKSIEGQLTRLKDTTMRAMNRIKMKEKNDKMRQEMYQKKDIDLNNLRERVKQLERLLQNHNIDHGGQPQDTPLNDTTEDPSTPLKDTPLNDTPLKDTPLNDTTEGPSPLKDATDIDESELDNSQGSSSSISVVDHGDARDVSVQFDYWVPMEGLLYGATVVDETVFNAHGDHDQTFNWSECGFSLHVPAGALRRTESCPVAVKALISGRFKFPKGFQLMSALYAISPGRKFTKNVKISIQHCGHLVQEEQLDRLCFIKAHGTSNPNDPYEFRFVKGGVFTTTSQYCELWQSDFSIYAAGECNNNDGGGDSGDDDDSSNPEGDGVGRNQSVESEHTGPEEQTEQAESGEQTGSGEQTEQAESGEQTGSGEQTEQTGSGEHTDSQDDTGPEDDAISNITNATDSTRDHESNDEIIGQRQQQQRQQRQDVTITSNQTIPAVLPLRTNKDLDQLYRARFFFETTERQRNNWNFKLVAIKHLAVHIKYVNDNFHDHEPVASFEFRFDPLQRARPAIALTISDTEINRLERTGWFVKPVITPCSISMENIEALATQDVQIQASEQQVVIADIPMCKVAVFATEGCQATHMECEVPVEGTDTRRTVRIVRQLETEAGISVPIGSQSPSSVKPHHTSPYGDVSPITDVKHFKTLLIDCLDQWYADLQSLLQGTLGTFAVLLFSSGMLSKHVKSSPTFDTIMSEVTSSLRFKRTPSAVIEHCRKLFSVLAEVGLPQKDAASCIAEEMTEATKNEFKTIINFY